MNQPSPKIHVASRLTSADGELQLAGVGVRRLAQRVGQTPFYAYDRSVISQTVANLRASLPSSLRLHYSVKANPMPAVVQHLQSLVDGLDVASAGELKIALDTGIDPRHISLTGPGKTDAELLQALAAGVVINVESGSEFERLAGLSKTTGHQAHVMVRINPDFELKSSGMKMAGGPKQFGVDAEVAPELLARIADLGIELHGLHVYSGSQNLNASALVEAQIKTFELLTRLCHQCPLPPTMINIGGGFGIPYFPGEQRLDLEPIAANLEICLKRFAEEFPNTQVAMEFGRYLVGEAGAYVMRVIDRKVSRGQVYLVVDGGLHHHLAASGNFGQVLRKNYPLVAASAMDAASVETVNVVGPLCTPLDLLGDHVQLPVLRVGDLIAILQSGAYGYSASPHGFLGHPAPLEVLV